MAKKISQEVIARLTKNTAVEKGGAWLLTINCCNEETHSAWSNPSAAKRFLKAFVIENTPRKSIKMEIKATNDAGKPTHLEGKLSYKVDA
jgi:hypothetical protein